jgi:hypothetical protein
MASSSRMAAGGSMDLSILAAIRTSISSTAGAACPSAGRRIGLWWPEFLFAF